MIGSIIGDAIGSRFEFDNVRTKDFPLLDSVCTFTDDSVCSIAVADFLLSSAEHGVGGKSRAVETLQSWCLRYPNRGYGTMFLGWINNPVPYDSFGNGAAMRITPVGFMAPSELDLFKMSDAVTSISHNHPEGIKGARAIALVIFLALGKSSKAEIRSRIISEFGYNLDFTCDSIRASNRFDETCQVTVPQAIVAFLESTDFIDAIRLAISIGGDSDTIAAMVGGMAEAFYQEIPPFLVSWVLGLLPDEMVEVLYSFYDYLPDGFWKI